MCNQSPLSPTQIHERAVSMCFLSSCPDTHCTRRRCMWPHKSRCELRARAEDVWLPVDLTVQCLVATSAQPSPSQQTLASREQRQTRGKLKSLFNIHRTFKQFALRQFKETPWRKRFVEPRARGPFLFFSFTPVCGSSSMWASAAKRTLCIPSLDGMNRVLHIDS